MGPKSCTATPSLSFQRRNLKARKQKVVRFQDSQPQPQPQGLLKKASSRSQTLRETSVSVKNRLGATVCGRTSQDGNTDAPTTPARAAAGKPSLAAPKKKRSSWRLSLRRSRLFKVRRQQNAVRTDKRLKHPPPEMRQPEEDERSRRPISEQIQRARQNPVNAGYFGQAIYTAVAEKLVDAQRQGQVGVDAIIDAVEEELNFRIGEDEVLSVMKLEGIGGYGERRRSGNAVGLQRVSTETETKRVLRVVNLP